MRFSILAILVLAACGGGGGPDQPTADGGHGGDGGSADDDCPAPPADACDGTALVTSSGPGTRSGGTCHYTETRSDCPFGCDAGACEAQACTPTCGADACTDDGCGGLCGACPSSATISGVTTSAIGTAADLRVAPDGVHVLAIRDVGFAPAGCPSSLSQVGTLDVWTAPATGAATKRTIGRHVDLSTIQFTGDGYLIFADIIEPCTGSVTVWSAKLDGTSAREIAVAAGAPTLVGGTLFYPTRSSPAGEHFVGELVGVPIAAGRATGPAVQLGDIEAESSYGYAPDGSAAWIEYSFLDLENLVLGRMDGTRTTLLDGDSATLASLPEWSPAGARLAFAAENWTSQRLEVHVVDAATAHDALLDADCVRCGDGADDYNYLATTVWSSDGAKLAWLSGDAPAVRVHAFAAGAGADAMLGNVYPDADTTILEKVAFARGDARIYAVFRDSFRTADVLVGGAVTGGSMATLAPSITLASDWWTETADGGTLAVVVPGTGTKLVRFSGAGTTNVTIAGLPNTFPIAPALEPVATAPRWLVAHGATALGLYGTDGSGAGTQLPGFATSNDLASTLPQFVIGWAGSAALYPGNPQGAYPDVTFDLHAQAGARAGLLGTNVARFSVANARVFYVQASGALVAVTGL